MCFPRYDQVLVSIPKDEKVIDKKFERKKKERRTNNNPGQPYPCTVRTLPMEGEEGGVAASLIIPVGEPWEGGDVEGTAKLTATPSSVSP